MHFQDIYERMLSTSTCYSVVSVAYIGLRTVNIYVFAYATLANYGNLALLLWFMIGKVEAGSTMAQHSLDMVIYSVLIIGVRTVIIFPNCL